MIDKGVQPPLSIPPLGTKPSRRHASTTGTRGMMLSWACRLEYLKYLESICTFLRRQGIALHQSESRDYYYKHATSGDCFCFVGLGNDRHEYHSLTVH